MIRNVNNINLPSAAYDIPAFSLIGINESGFAVFADYLNVPCIGITVNDYMTGEHVSFITNGEVENSNWSFEKTEVNDIVFLASNGTISTNIPTYIIQKIGTIIGRSKILISISDYIILNPTLTPTVTPTPTPFP